MTAKSLCYVIALVVCIVAFFGLGGFNWLAAALALIILAQLVN